MGRLATTLTATLTAALLSCVLVQPMRAQDSSAATGAAAARTAVLVRAQRLVNDGNGSSGRALIDSLLNAIEPRSVEEAEVLFWRATIAESWDQAQRDYLRVMLEHERSRFAPASMLRLAQGEEMRGDREAALRYADRLLTETPDAAEREEALALRARLSSVAASPSPTLPSVLPQLPATTTTPPAGSAPSTPAAPAPATRAPAPTGGFVWSVQIAAFPNAREAAAFAAESRTRGYDSRVDGVAAPFRVRFGRYPTRAAAAAAMEAYKTKERSDAFLAQVPR